MDKINANRIKRRDAIVETCQSFISFDYKTSASSSVTFQYKECGGIVNTMTIPLSPTGGIFVTETFDEPICIVEGTLVRIAGLAAVNNFVYGTCTG